MGNYILNAAMVIATVWIVKRFWKSFFEKKKTSFFSVIVWIIFCLFQMVFQLNREGIHIWMTVFNGILILIIAISGYRCIGKRKYFMLMVFSAVWALIEFFVFFILNFVSSQAERLDIIGVVISKILMIMFVYVVSMYWNRQREEFVPNNFYIYLLFFPVGSICIAINEFNEKGNTFSSICTISILLVFNVLIFELYIKMNEIFMNEYDKAMYAQQIEIISGNTAEQKKIMEEFYREKHDLANELVSLKGCIEGGNMESLNRNLDKIIHSYKNVEKVCNTGNSTVDAIINFKYAAASEYGIKFCLKIFIPNELAIDVCDIGIVLGNAIDNAIEAVRRCINKEKVIQISMGVKKEAWVIVIKNPYEHEIEKDKTGLLVSTKQNKQKHGYGSKSITRIAEKYQGESITETQNGIFSLTIVLNFREL